MLVPVLNINKEPLMPCSPKRARQMMEKGQAKSYWQKGIFSILLLKKSSDNKKQKIVLGLDTGSKREGYTIATEKAVIFNITTNTPNWIQDHIENRRNLRRTRRRRKTPYRKMRLNRAPSKRKNRLPPSTKARWDAKLRVIKILLKIIPISHIRIEEIQANLKKNSFKWNKSFFPLKEGKNYFKQEIDKLKLIFSKNNGWETFEHRQQRGFKKSSQKLDYKWETHNVDSHSLVEMELKIKLMPVYGFYQLEYLEFHRRQLHVQNPKKNGARKSYGSTISAKMSRGSVIKYRNKLFFLGGNSKRYGKLTISIHSILNGTRIYQRAFCDEVKLMHNNSFRIQYIPFDKKWKEQSKLTITFKKVNI